MKRLFTTCAIFIALALPSAASAKDFGIISTGDELVQIGPLPEVPGRVVGSLCQHVGVFWANVYTWDCRLVVTDKDLQRYSEIPATLKPAMEARYSLANAQRGTWKSYGIFILIALLVFSIWKKRPAG